MASRRPDLWLGCGEEQHLLADCNPKTFTGGWTHSLLKVRVGETQESSLNSSPSIVVVDLKAQQAELVSASLGWRQEWYFSRIQNGWKEQTGEVLGKWGVVFCLSLRCIQTWTPPSKGFMSETSDQHDWQTQKHKWENLKDNYFWNINNYIPLHLLKRQNMSLYLLLLYVFFKLNLILYQVLLNTTPYITAERPNACKGTHPKDTPVKIFKKQKLKTKKHHGTFYWKGENIYFYEINFPALGLLCSIDSKHFKIHIDFFSNVHNISPLKTRLKLSYISSPLMITPRFNMKLWLEWVKGWV